MNALETCKLALGALEEARNELCEWSSDVNREDYNNPRLNSAITDLRQTIEQLEQAQPDQLAKLGWQKIDCPICGGGARAFSKPEQAQPVAHIPLPELEALKRDGRRAVVLHTTSVTNGIEVGLYTAPPPRKPWVGLTNDEIALVNANYPHPQGFARALQAKLKDKNT